MLFRSKNRLNRIAAQLEFVETRTSALPDSDTDPLERLAAGEITVTDATKALASRRRQNP